MVNLTQKERMLLQDQKSHEEICIQKYTNYAQEAQDPELKQLFADYAEQEKQHLNTINQMLNGEAPNLQQGRQNQQQQSGMQTQGRPVPMRGAMGNQKDAALCNDLLMTEKYVSGTYDTAIFEFTNTAMRQALNHIQKEEQQHGEGIFNYMQSRGMYNPQ